METSGKMTYEKEATEDELAVVALMEYSGQTSPAQVKPCVLISMLAKEAKHTCVLVLLPLAEGVHCNFACLDERYELGSNDI